MDTHKIKVLLSASKYKSLSRAAEEFSYTPSALSHTLSAFEKELGVKIFKRSSVGVELTAEGEALMPYFESVLRAESELLKFAGAMTDQRKYELKIATYASISRNFLTALIKDFKNQNPDLKLSVNVADDLNGWLESGRADIVFADDKVLFNNNFFPILEDEYCVIAPKGWLSDKSTVDRDELYAYPYIDTGDKFTENYFDKSNFSELISFKSEDDLSVINMVKEGMGIALLPELLLKERNVGVSVIPLLPRLTRTLGFAYEKRGLESVALSKFIKYVKSVKVK